MLVVSMDIAPTHTGAVALRYPPAGPALDAQLAGHWFITTKAGVAKRGKERAFALLPSATKGLTPGARRMARLDALRRLVGQIKGEVRAAELEIDLVVVEDYVFHGATAGAHDAGGAGDVVRYLWWSAGVPMREIPPGEVKRFACHRWNAPKEEVPEAVRERWPNAERVFSRYLIGKDVDTYGDLCDAYVLARIGLAELMIRRGWLTLDALAHDAERQVFLGTTKHRPVNLLQLPFTRREA